MQETARVEDAKKKTNQARSHFLVIIFESNMHFSQPCRAVIPCFFFYNFPYRRDENNLRNLQQEKLKIQHYANLIFWTFAKMYLTNKEYKNITGDAFCHKHNVNLRRITSYNIDETMFDLHISHDNVPESVLKNKAYDQKLQEKAAVSQSKVKHQATCFSTRSILHMWKHKAHVARILCTETQAQLLNNPLSQEQPSLPSNIQDQLPADHALQIDTSIACL